MILNKIRALCNTKGISTYSLEKELGLSNSAILKWKTSSPSVENLKKVADYFGVTVDELLEDK